MTKQPKSAKKRQDATAPPFKLSDKKRTNFDGTFEGVARLLQGKKNIIVLVGAGISVSCGIPDFRSKDSGLYATLDIGELGLSCPEELFDWDFFQEDPSPFYKFARNLYFPAGESKKIEPSDSHKLLAMLEQKRMLLRVYTQNIDGLENVAGVSNKKMVYAHGSLQWASCCQCQRKVCSESIMPAITKGSVPYCQAERKTRRNSNTSNASVTASPREPSQRVAASPREPSQRAKKRPRTSAELVCGGVLKPAVTFFGETLSDSVRRALENDRDKVDGLIVIGTSLSVAPISKVIEYLPPNIPRILINRTIVHPSTASPEDSDEEEDFREGYVFDAYLLGYCDDVTRCLAKALFQQTDNGETDSKSRRRNKRETYSGRMLTSVLKGNSSGYSADDWELVTVPPERVLLFPGAKAPTDETSEPTYQEIAHCDGCSKRIRGAIHKCVACFDYDLCSKCYPTLSKTHHEGTHSFNVESGC